MKLNQWQQLSCWILNLHVLVTSNTPWAARQGPCLCVSLLLMGLAQALIAWLASKTPVHADRLCFSLRQGETPCNEGSAVNFLTDTLTDRGLVTLVFPNHKPSWLNCHAPLYFPSSHYEQAAWTSSSLPSSF